MIKDIVCATCNAVVRRVFGLTDGPPILFTHCNACIAAEARRLRQWTLRRTR